MEFHRCGPLKNRLRVAVRLSFALGRRQDGLFFWSLPDVFLLMRGRSVFDFCGKRNEATFYAQVVAEQERRKTMLIKEQVIALVRKSIKKLDWKYQYDEDIN